MAGGTPLSTMNAVSTIHDQCGAKTVAPDDEGERERERHLQRHPRTRRDPREPGLTKLSVLAHIYRAGAATPGEIATAERLQPQSLSRVIADLTAEGMITRSRDERDRRQYVLELTPLGGRAPAADMGARDRRLAEAMAGLSETEREVLYLAGKLMDRLSGLGRVSADQVRGVAGERRAEVDHAELREQDHEHAERDEDVRGA